MSNETTITLTDEEIRFITEFIERAKHQLFSQVSGQEQMQLMMLKTKLQAKLNLAFFETQEHKGL